MLVSSHALSEVQQTADRVVIIDHGRLVCDARLDELTTGRRVLMTTPDTERFGGLFESTGATVRREGGRLAGAERFERPGGGSAGPGSAGATAPCRRTGPP